MPCAKRTSALQLELWSFLLAGVFLTPTAIYGADEGSWRYYSGDNGSTKYSPLAQINKSNAARLRIVWRQPFISPDFLAEHPSARISNNYRTTPIYVNGVLYASTALGQAMAFDPETGRTLWTQSISDSEPLDQSNRGVAYWGEGPQARVVTFRNQYLYALDPHTGEPLSGFGERGRVNLSEGLGPYSKGYHWHSAPLIVRDVIVVGSAPQGEDSASRKEGEPGIVRGYDARTGKLLWTFHVIPREGEPGIETWEGDSWKYTGSGNVWPSMSADEELGYIYLPTSSPTMDMYGGHRLGNTLYSNSIVCLNAATGKMVWYFQTVHHDLFDYDNPTAPILADIKVNGRRIKAVVQVTKQAFTYVLDRTTGKPVWPIEERPVPASTVPGERASPTQPFPTKPPPFDRQGITTDDLIDFTPELRAEAVEILKDYITGPVFTPPSVAGREPGQTKGTIQLPGSAGGANWTGPAFDKETGILYVPSFTNPFVANLIPGDPEKTDLRYIASTRPLISGPRGLPLLKPPYGRITALDLNRGEKLWTIANGDGPRDNPAIKNLNLPPLGQAVFSSAMVTKSLLFVTEGDQINTRTPPNGGGHKLRAVDKATGAVVWETDLDAGSTGNMMTYMHKGKQYLVFAIGGRNHGGELIAFALP